MGLKTWLGLRKPKAPLEPPAFVHEFGLMRSHSQLFQDFWALSETGQKRGGFFVEIGAFDGINLSNTYLLEKEFGWAGILAEPNPRYGDEIRRIRSASLCTLPVHSKSGQEVSIHYDESSPEMSRMAEGGTVQTTISLNDLLALFDAPRHIDFMSIDTEGNEIDILSTFDSDRYEVRLMCVEYNSAEPALDALMGGRGYERVYHRWSQWDAWYRKV